MGFFGLDVALVYVAFKLNYRSGRLYETVELTPAKLTWTRVHPSGRREQFDCNPYWARVNLREWPDGRTDLQHRVAGQGAGLRPLPHRRRAPRFRLRAEGRAARRPRRRENLRDAHKKRVEFALRDALSQGSPPLITARDDPCSTHPSPPTAAAPLASDRSRDYELIRRAIAFLSETWTEQPSLERLAEHLGLSPAHCQKLFKRWCGLSPKEFVQAITVDHARGLLEGSASVLDAALRGGPVGRQPAARPVRLARGHDARRLQAPRRGPGDGLRLPCLARSARRC